jgi:dTDP-4-dehydrorhamnose reductase
VDDVTEAARPVLITGAEGLLARALAARLATVRPVVACSRRELDITSLAAVRARTADVRPSVILNCAAWNDVDGSEDAPEAALAVNALGVRVLARAAAEHGAALVHYSSDFVFDGSAQAPYTEDDVSNPRGVYAASKLLGEWFAPDAGRWFVLRVESLFGAAHWPGTRRIGSLDRLIDALESGRPARAFVDRVASPSYVLDVAEATAALLDADAPSGVYHVVNSGHATWLELAREAARHIGGAATIIPIAAAELPLKAPRPMFAALSNRRLAAAAYRMPSWQDAIARYLAFRAGRTRAR